MNGKALLSNIGAWFSTGGEIASITGPAREALAEKQAESATIISTYREDLTRMQLVTLGVDFTPENIFNFRRLARFGDPRYLYDFYTEMMRLGPGPQVTKMTEAMKSATAQFLTYPESWDDDHRQPDDADPAEVEIARACRHYAEDIFSPWLADLIGINGAGMHTYGIADSKVILDPRGNSGRWDAIADVIEVPQRRHRLDPISHEWMLMLSPESWDGTPVSSLKLSPYQGTEGLFFTEVGAGSHHLDQRGLLFQCLVYWLVEQYGMRWWSKWVELYGIPPRMGFEDFAFPERVAAMNTSLANMGAAAYGVFQKGSDVKLLEASGGGTNNPHENLVAACRRGYDAVILGHEQASGVQKGVGGKVQGANTADEFRDITNSRLRTFSIPLRRDLCRALIARAFGPDVAAKHTPIIKLRYQERDDPATLAATAVQLKQAGAGVFVSAEDLVRRCGLKLAAEGEANLGAADPVAAPSAPGAPAGLPLAAPGQSLAAGKTSPVPAPGAPDGLGAETRDQLRAEIRKVTTDADLHTLVARIDRLPRPDVRGSADLLAAAHLEAAMKGFATAKAARELAKAEARKIATFPTAVRP